MAHYKNVKHQSHFSQLSQGSQGMQQFLLEDLKDSIQLLQTLFCPCLLIVHV